MIHRDELGDELAHVLSEWLNDNAPLGERMYRAPGLRVAQIVVGSVKAEVGTVLNLSRAMAPHAMLPAAMSAADAYTLGITTMAGSIEFLIESIERDLK